MTDHGRKYDVASEFPNVPSGIMFGQLLRGEPMEAKKEIYLLFFSRSAKRKLNMVFAAREFHGRRVRNVSMLRVYGSEDFALMTSSCSVPNYMYKTLVDRLGLTLEEARRTITVATGVQSAIVGTLTDFPIAFGDMVVQL